MTENKIIDVNQATFQAEVLQRSYKEPVIVDFWAPWCGPCRMLGPVLERLAREANTGFVLAKLNTDENPQLAGQYNIRGIPAVKAFRDGKVVDEFVGALPEPNVRAFIEGVVPANGHSHRAAPSTARPDTAEGKFAAARDLLMQGRGCEAEAQLAGLPEPRAQALLPLARFLCAASKGRALAGGTAVQAEMQQAAYALQHREHAAALYSLLAATNQSLGAAKTDVTAIMEGVFALLGEDSAIARQYRSYLKPA